MFRNKKSRRIITVVIAVVLIIAMVIPIVISALN